ncbi:aminoglycoside adenylyltransferase domain-containing protein [Brassicibacter mesophilus]|uniref:aminoglycoside adenylyltransferase domain-containing protein n=1 Tax=Brassicibacter mesophilus TaxID=745119 RepID=UPI003D1DF6A0
MEPINILDIVVERYRKELDENLVGIYLHGSLAMGCYTNTSDIDILVVVREPIDMNEKKNLIHSIIYLENLPKKGIEMSIILEKYARKFVYPTPFELHYSDYHRDRYLSDEKYICGGMTDRDLAAHLTIVKHRGICLYGKEIEETFGGVPKEDYIDSILYDIENAKEEIIKNPVYITLNLCRVLCYLKEEAICSKLEGGNWGKEVVPQPYRKIIEDAVKIYTNELKDINYDKDRLVEYADYMLKEINTYR